MNKIGSKILIFTLILALLLPSFALLPSKKALAQGGTTASTYGGGSGLYGGSGGITIGGQSISVGQIGSAITGCAGVGIKQLFTRFNIGNLGLEKAQERAIDAEARAEDARDRALIAWTEAQGIWLIANGVMIGAGKALDVAEKVKPPQPGVIKAAEEIYQKAVRLESNTFEHAEDARKAYLNTEKSYKFTQESAKKAVNTTKNVEALAFARVAEFNADKTEEQAEKAEEAAKKAKEFEGGVSKLAKEVGVKVVVNVLEDFIKNSVPTYDKVVQTAINDEIREMIKQFTGISLKLDKTIGAIGKVEDRTQKVEKITDRQRLKEVCFDGIMYSIARVLLRNFTAATIEWINTGFLEKTIDEEGNVEEKKKPLYLENTREFFTNIFEQETKGFANFLLQFDNPFGEAVAKSLMASISRRFENQARFTLREFVRGGDYEAYYLDFSLGGWPAWLALTQIPANNPIGFRFMAAEEHADRTRGPKRLSLAEELNLDLRFSGGFLSIKKCVRATAEGQDKIGPNKPFTDVGDLPVNNRQLCARYAVQTPGQAVASLLNISTTTSFRQLELVDELNESLAAIFDAFLAKLITKGLSEIDKAWFDETDQDIVDHGVGTTTSSTTFIGGSFPDPTDEDIEELETIPFPVQVEELKITAVQAFTTPSERRVKLDAQDEMVAKFIFASGFDSAAAISELIIGFSSSNQNITSLAGGKILVGGIEVNDNVLNISSAGTTFSLSGFTLAPRSTIQVEIRADIFSDDGQGGNFLFDGDTITISVLPHTSNAVVDATLVDAPEDEAVGQEIKVMGPSIFLVKDNSYSDQNVSINDFPIDNNGDGFEIGRWILTGNTTRDVSIQTITFDIDENPNTGDTFKEENISNMYVMYGTERIDPLLFGFGISTDGQDNTFFVFEVLPQGDPDPEEITISLFATLDIDPDLDPPVSPTINNSFKTDLTIVAYDATTFETVEIEDVEGQTITVQ